MKYAFAVVFALCSSLATAQTVVTTKITYRTDSTVLAVGTSTVTVTNNSDSLLVKQSDGSVIQNIYAIVNTTTVTPTTSRDLRYEITTVTLSNGKKVVTQRLVSDTVNTANKTTPSTVRDLVRTVLVSGPTTAVPVKSAQAQSVAVDYNPATYSASTYYNSPHMGTPTPVFSNDPRAWINTESVNKSNEIIGANYAWARGWTGKGSTVLVMDTGIDLSNKEFAGKIKYQLDLTQTGLQDVVGHGSNIAGIIAAARNGSGMNGVAFDANLAVAKISNNTSISSGMAQQALAWAGQFPDVVAANYSGNTLYSTTYKNSVKSIAPGVYASSDPVYGGKNYYNLESPQAWANALTPRIVLTVSAGNSTLPYPQNPATFATATDSNGKLLLNGQMLIVGNWNEQARRVEGALAGTVCKDVVNNVCKDKYRVSDFYILAPGMLVNGPVPTKVSATGYQSQSGTSQAAPAVAGAVAIINQLWPYMTAANQAQLLLKTANKNLPGYSPETMGQGLLDLNAATKPVGAVGITLTGRTGQVMPISGGIALNASAGAVAQTKATLSSISVVDSLQRDFTVNLSGGVGKNTLMSDSMTMDAEPGFNWSGRWAGLAGHQYQHQPISGAQAGGNSTVTLDSRVFAPTAELSHQITLTNSTQNPFVNFSGSWGNTTGSTTLEYSALKQSNSGWWVQGGVMQTLVNHSPGLVSSVTPIMSMHAAVGNQIGDWNVFAGIKPTVVAGAINFNTPTSVDVDGNMNYTQTKTNLNGVAPVPYAGVKWKHNFSQGSALTLRVSMAQDKSSSAKIYYTKSL